MNKLYYILWLSIVCSTLRVIYNLCIEFDKNLYLKKAKFLHDTYEAICTDLDISGIEIGNRPKEIKMDFDAELQIITADSCLPYEIGPPTEKCHQDLKAILNQRIKYGVQGEKVRDQVNQAMAYFNKKLSIESWPRKLGSEMALRVNLRNKYFVSYMYSQLNNIGNCGELSAQVMYRMFATLANQKMTDGLKMQLMIVKKNANNRVQIYGETAVSIQNHVFIVIGGNYPVGKFEISATSNDLIKTENREGWICDLWNKNVKFGPVKELIKSDPVYDVTKWKIVEIRDLSLPRMSNVDFNQEFIQRDFMSDPRLFYTLILENDTLMRHMIVGQEKHYNEATTEKAIIAAINLPIIEDIQRRKKKQRSSRSIKQKEL